MLPIAPLGLSVVIAVARVSRAMVALRVDWANSAPSTTLASVFPTVSPSRVVTTVVGELVELAMFSTLVTVLESACAAPIVPT